MRLTLVRHALTRLDADSPARAWALTPDGTAAAALGHTGRWADVCAVYASTEGKALLTAKPIADSAGLDIQRLSALDEVGRGGLFIEDYESQVAQFFASPDQSVGDWEPTTAALTRGLSAVTALLRRHRGEHIVAVGHGLLLALLRAHLIGQDRVRPAEWRAIRMPDVSTWLFEPEPHLLEDFEGIRSLASSDHLV